MQIVQQFIDENCPQEIALHAQQLRAGISYIADQAGRLCNKAISDLTKALKSTEDFETTLRVVVESISLYNIIQSVHSAATPLLATLDTFRTVVSTNRIMKSIQYVVSGTIVKDIAAGNMLSIVSELAFFAARSIKATVWLNEKKLLSDAAFARISETIGTFSSSLNIPKIPRAAVVDGLFVFALIPCAIKDAQNIAAGRDIPYNLVDLISLCSDIALCIFSVIRESQVLEMVGASLCTSAISFVVANPYVLGVLGVVAATTGFIAIFLHPSTQN